jgi:hypothetical protein
MQSNRTRAVIALAAIAIAVVLFVVLSGGNNDSGTKSNGQAGNGPSGAASNKPAYDVVVQGGKPAGGIKKMAYTKGEQVRFTVHSDVADEIHVHGYNFKKDVSAGGTVKFSFPATIVGVFVIELESRARQIAQLRVNPS